MGLDLNCRKERHPTTSCQWLPTQPRSVRPTWLCLFTATENTTYEKRRQRSQTSIHQRLRSPSRLVDDGRQFAYHRPRCQRQRKNWRRKCYAPQQRASRRSCRQTSSPTHRSHMQQEPKEHPSGWNLGLSFSRVLCCRILWIWRADHWENRSSHDLGRLYSGIRLRLPPSQTRLQTTSATNLERPESSKQVQ